jgi:hypothetical protein
MGANSYRVRRAQPDPAQPENQRHKSRHDGPAWPLGWHLSGWVLLGCWMRWYSSHLGGCDRPTRSRREARLSQRWSDAAARMTWDQAVTLLNTTTTIGTITKANRFTIAVLRATGCGRCGRCVARCRSLPPPRRPEPRQQSPRPSCDISLPQRALPLPRLCPVLRRGTAAGAVRALAASRRCILGMQFPTTTVQTVPARHFRGTFTDGPWSPRGRMTVAAWSDDSPHAADRDRSATFANRSVGGSAACPALRRIAAMRIGGLPHGLRSGPGHKPEDYPRVPVVRLSRRHPPPRLRALPSRATSRFRPKRQTRFRQRGRSRRLPRPERSVTSTTETFYIRNRRRAADQRDRDLHVRARRACCLAR